MMKEKTYKTSVSKRAANAKWDKENRTVICCKVDFDTKARFTSACQERGETVSDVLHRAIEEYLNA